MSSVYKALADPTRREILKSISREPSSISDIAKAFEMSRPAVAKHIKILEKSKLLQIKKDPVDKRQRNCYAQLEALEEVNQYLTELHSFWGQKLDQLDHYLNQKS